jgi:hypothetical protein
MKLLLLHCCLCWQKTGPGAKLARDWQEEIEHKHIEILLLEAAGGSAREIVKIREI